MADSSIFISYSRHDTALVGPLTQLLRATGSGVFRDMESIQPGTKWRVAISDAIDSCQTFLLFWCAHSARSQEVKVEYAQAITLSLPVVPILLDRSVLPPELAEYQAIDLSGALGDHLTEAPGLKGREPAYILRRPGDSELDQGRAALIQGLAALIAT